MHNKAMTTSVTDDQVETACRAYYNCGLPVFAPVFEGMRAALEAALRSQGKVVEVSKLKELVFEWRRTSSSLDGNGCAYDLTAIIGEGD